MTDKRTVAIVGASMSGKTTLLESMLFISGAIGRKGSVKEGNSVGDGSEEARARHVSTEISAASCTYKDVEFNLIDCPGSIEFIAEAQNALMGVDAALVVCEAVPERMVTLAPLFRFLNDNEIPHLAFINKIDRASGLIRDLIPAMRGVSGHPLVLHQVPIRDGETITGYVDLVSGKAYSYNTGGASQEVEMPDSVGDRSTAARTELLESLSDFDDTLLETLLEDNEPSEEEIRDYVKAQVAANQVVPVFLGAAELEGGVRRLMDHMVTMVPDAAATVERRGIDAAGGPLVQVLKTYMTPHAGKLSLVRVWRGELPDGTVLNGERIAGIYRMTGTHQEKLPGASAGDIVALGRLESARTGDTLAEGNHAPDDALPRADIPPAVYALAIGAENRDDEVKLSAAVAKILEEDPSLSIEQNPATNDFVLHGQGEIHLKVALARLSNKYHLPLTTRTPRIAYKEAIRKPVSQHGRFKRQTGGHGMFGDVHIDVKPLPRGSGFRFTNTIVGGSVPKQYIPAVEAGVREFLVKGPLGFPVVDVSVTLTDGSFHAVDSNEQSFKLAARMAMTEAMPKCSPVLLEPICHVTISVPNDATSKVHALISGRRGQILGFQAKEGWEGWDEVETHMPEAEVRELILELRSLTQGIGWHTFEFDHLNELTGRPADMVLAEVAERKDH